MQKDHKQLWADCLQLIKNDIGEDQFNKWFRDITSLRFENRQLHLFVPSEFFVEYIEGKYLRELGTAIRKVYGDGISLRYAYNLKADDPETMIDVASNRPSSTVISASSGTSTEAAEKSQYKPNTLNPQLNPQYNLENYCCSASNRIAYTIAEAIAEHPKMRTFNPFFIFGDTGVGKTHLIQGIGIRILENNPQTRVLYITSRQFESQYTTAVATGGTNQFFKFYQSIDVLIVDDVQDLQNKPGTQNTFYNIFNYLHLNNKLIIFSSDRAPAEMEGFESRLLGRFKSGSTVHLEKPDLGLRRQVLKRKADVDGIELDNETVEYIVSNVTESIRDLQGVIASLLAHATVCNRPVSLDLAKEIVANAVKITRSQLNFEIIVQKVSAFYNVNPDALFTPSRKREISDARQMVMYLAKKHTQMPLTAIGRSIARTHATVIYSIKNIEERLGIEKQLQNDVQAIESTLFV